MRETRDTVNYLMYPNNMYDVRNFESLYTVLRNTVPEFVYAPTSGIKPLKKWEANISEE